MADRGTGETEAPEAKTAVGLSTAAAKSKLLAELDADHTRVLIPPHIDRRSQSLRVILGVTAVVVVGLLVDGGYMLGRGEPRQTRGIGSVVEAGLLVAAVLVTYRVIVHESRLETRELDMRLRAISKEIQGWTGIYADLRTPQLPTVTTYTALRDGVWRDVPTLLLVEGDTVALAYGEAAPCRISLRGAGRELDRGQKFTPETMRGWQLAARRPQESSNESNARNAGDPSPAWDPSASGHPALTGRVLFHVRTTPLSKHLEQLSLHHQRTGRSVLQNQMRVVIRLCALRVMPAVCAAAVVANAIIYGVVSVGQEAHSRMGVEAIVGKSVYVAFPFACTALWPVLWIGARIFTNSSEVVLFDTLQRSKTEYEDTDNIDEFDVEALPPTKDVTVGMGAIMERMRWLWWNCDFRTLSRSSNLTETLGNITVICSIDKEGTIAEPFCTPEQIVVPDADDYAILDVGEQQVGAETRTFIIDEGWERFLPSLRPLGLGCSLGTAAHRLGRDSANASTHRRHTLMHRHGKILPSQDTCLCRLGRAIGFTDKDLARYEKLKEVDVFAPFHEATDALVAKDVFCAASFTSTVMQPHGGAPGELQMLTDGNVDLVLGMCLDYFDGSGIRPLDDHTIAMYYSLYLNALQQDLQCLAFAYRPLSVDTGAIKWPGWETSKAIAEASTAQGRFIELHLSKAELQAALDGQRTAKDNAAGTSVVSATAPVETASIDKRVRKTVESGSGADASDDRTPVSNSDSGVKNADSNANGGHEQKRFGVSDHNDDDDDSDEVATHSSSLDDLPDHLTEDARTALLRRKAKFSRALLAQLAVEEQDYSKAMLAQLAIEEDMLRDAVTEQIFVGLATFAYEPKTDVCDFIEDLDVAGIRFVYFSRAGGRQSKAFAERLGLETDWNTCILLSSAADGTQGDGYIEDHDIKARLPRGIENIRQHLRDVDDIPLQISLFAESTPASTREMIKISQEYGDVVCCIGSALKDSNTLTFAAADLAVGVEPIPHFNRVFYGGGQDRDHCHNQIQHTQLDHPSENAAQASAVALRSAVLSGHDMANDGSISTSGALVTQYALGAALTCIPCPLFLQHDTSLYMLMQVISEARRLVGCMQQAAIFLACTCLALALTNLVAAMCLLPPPLPGFMVLWLLWVVAPILAVALLFAPHDENIMSTMPLRNHSHVSDLPRFSVYAALRMLPPIAITLVVYATALATLLDGSPGLRRLSSAIGRKDWLALSHSDQWALRAAQTYAMVAFAFHCACVSSTMVFRTRTWLDFVPIRNAAWVAGAAASIALTFALAALLLAFGDAAIARVPWYTYVVALAGPVVLLPLQDLCKLHDRKKWARLQKLAKLEFKTKLGLHSPL
ncbi:hypothetical protein EV175_003944 [Coemansia sp. RSA 1933]|nr:hypothetical protein EV175_003944 [Coemansia sp. RSA 1933]